MGIDEVGIDKVGIDKVGITHLYQQVIIISLYSVSSKYFVAQLVTIQQTNNYTPIAQDRQT